MHRVERKQPQQQIRKRGEERRYSLGPQIYLEEKRARVNLCKKMTPGAHSKPQGEKEFFLADRLVKGKNHHKLGT